MLAQEQLKQLQQLTNSLSNEELIWTQGFLAGVLSTKTVGSNTQPLPVTTSATKKLTILYGTETGNSKSLATRFAQRSKQSGIVSKLVSLDQYRLTDLSKEENLLVVMSTHGEGEPPATAKKFYEYVHTDSVKLSKTNFAVLALGDTAYPLFCKAGED